MDQVYVASNETPFAATTGEKTLLKIVTPTGFNIKIHEVGVSMDGVTSTHAPARLRFFTSDETTAGTGTGSPTIVQIKGAALAHGCTVTANHTTTQGTTYTYIKGLYVPQFMGVFVMQNPLGLEEQSPAGTADSIGLTINVSNNVNVLAWIKFSRS